MGSVMDNMEMRTVMHTVRWEEGNTLGDGLIFGLLYMRDGDAGLRNAIDDFTPDLSENPKF